MANQSHFVINFPSFPSTMTQCDWPHWTEVWDAVIKPIHIPYHNASLYHRSSWRHETSVLQQHQLSVNNRGSILQIESLFWHGFLVFIFCWTRAWKNSVLWFCQLTWLKNWLRNGLLLEGINDSRLRYSMRSWLDRKTLKEKRYNNLKNMKIKKQRQSKHLEFKQENL